MKSILLFIIFVLFIIQSLSVFSLTIGQRTCQNIFFQLQIMNVKREVKTIKTLKPFSSRTRQAIFSFKFNDGLDVLIALPENYLPENNWLRKIAHQAHTDLKFVITSYEKIGFKLPKFNFLLDLSSHLDLPNGKFYFEYPGQNSSYLLYNFTQNVKRASGRPFNVKGPDIDLGFYINKNLLLLHEAGHSYIHYIVNKNFNLVSLSLDEALADYLSFLSSGATLNRLKLITGTRKSTGNAEAQSFYFLKLVSYNMHKSHEDIYYFKKIIESALQEFNNKNMTDPNDFFNFIDYYIESRDKD